LGLSAHLGTPGTRIGYRRLRRLGTGTPWKSWRQNIYLRKLDRLLGRTSWKFLRSFGSYSYWGLRCFLNFREWQLHQNLQLTTSAALIIVGFGGVLCGKGHAFTPVATAVITAALLAWKQPITGFATGLSDVELRSAVLLAILSFIVYPPRNLLAHMDLFSSKRLGQQCF
jgi:hypothetical protein